MIKYKFILTILLNTLLININAQKSEYISVMNADNSVKYESFIKEYPKSKYLSLVKKQYEKSEYYKVYNSTSKEKLQNFLANFPDSKYYSTIQQQLNTLIENEAWEDAIRKDDSKTYIKFENDYPHTQYHYETVKKKDIILLKNAINRNDLNSYQILDLLDKKKYLEEHTAFIKLKNKAAELFYSQVLKNPSEEHCIEYLKLFPNSNHILDAWRILEKNPSLSALYHDNVIKNKYKENKDKFICYSTICIVDNEETPRLIFKDYDLNFVEINTDGEQFIADNGFDLPIIKYLPPRYFYILCISKEHLESEEIFMQSLKKMWQGVNRYYKGKRANLIITIEGMPENSSMYDFLLKTQR